ncbi:hypothetical protein [Streptomyces umbrinus]|uniref:hypothetical protein n=1 Tax=Streptomyces umbrinus TaxID=67370 RepID=UPI0027D7C976|nr:hypothetical protein [Streptomyces umbrinus]
MSTTARWGLSAQFPAPLKSRGYRPQGQKPGARPRSGLQGRGVTKTLRIADAAEYKRRQCPPGTKISAKGFGKDRRLPVTNRPVTNRRRENV